MKNLNQHLIKTLYLKARKQFPGRGIVRRDETGPFASIEIDSVVCISCDERDYQLRGPSGIRTVEETFFIVQRIDEEEEVSAHLDPTDALDAAMKLSRQLAVELTA